MLNSSSAYADGRIRSCRRLLLAFLLTASVFVVELVVGVLSNSLSPIGDAGHMLVDSVDLTVGMVTFKLAMKLATKRTTYGYYRLEILAAFF